MAEFDYKEFARQMRENAVKDHNGNIICSPELWEQIAGIIERIPQQKQSRLGTGGLTMAEYIERDAVIEKLMNLDPPGFEHSIAGKVALMQIAAFPKADVVEVVRCEKCKHYETSDWDGEILCGCNHPSGLKDVEPNAHCSFGERKE